MLEGHQPLAVRPAAVLRRDRRIGRQLCEAERRYLSTRQGDADYWPRPCTRPEFKPIVGSIPSRRTAAGSSAACARGASRAHPGLLADPVRASGREASEIERYAGRLAFRCCAKARRRRVSHLIASRSWPFTQKQIELAHDLRRPGGDRDRERAAVRRGAGPHDELARSVEELQALGEVSHAVNSTLDLETVLNTIVAKAVQLSGDRCRRDLRLSAICARSSGCGDLRHERRADRGDRRAEDRPRRDLYRRGGPAARAIQVARPRDEPPTPMRDLVLQAGYRALLVVPLLRPDRIIGAPRRPAQGARTVPRNPRSTSCRPLRRNPCSRSRMRACSARSSRRAASSRLRASTSRSSSPI